MSYVDPLHYEDGSPVLAGDDVEIADAASSDARVAARLTTQIEKRLISRQSIIAPFSNYYEGNHPLLFASEKFRDAFGGLFREFADNWCELVVDAVEERLNPQGFRFGDVEEPDKAAWNIWQANHLDAESKLAHTEALVNGMSYVLIWYDDDNPEMPAISVEHPFEMIVTFASGSRRNRTAALKRWYDEDSERLFATLYLPDAVWKFQSGRKSEMGITTGPSVWAQRLVPGEDWPLKNPLGVVPVIPLENRPRLMRSGVSEIRRVMPLQDAVNKLVADMIVASEFGAFRQRWAAGIDIPIDPDTGKAIEPFRAAVDRLWVAELRESDENGPAMMPQFGEFSETRLDNFTNAIEMIVQHIASQSRTPPHYFYLSGQFPSGESIKSAETGLVAKVRDRMIPFGEAWEEVIRLGLAVSGNNEAANIVQSETIWGDPESRSESEHIDALMKLAAIGVPEEILWEKAGFSPTEIARIKQLKKEEAAEQAAALAAATAAGQLPPPGGDISGGVDR